MDVAPSGMDGVMPDGRAHYSIRYFRIHGEMFAECPFCFAIMHEGRLGDHTERLHESRVDPET